MSDKSTKEEFKESILLLGASTQSAIYVAKQLSIYGLSVSIVDWHKVPINRSRYIDHYYNLGSPIDDEKNFFSALLKLLSNHSYKGILPIHDPAVELCQKHFEELSKYTKVIGINAPEVYKYAHDKWELIDVAKKVNLSIPESFLIDNIDKIEEVIKKVSFPCVVKPVSSSMIVNNKVLEFRVNIAETKEQLIDYIREYINNVPLIIQEFIQGYGIGYNIISNKGEILNAYIHRRINENKGISSYRESVPLATYDLETSVTKLIKEIQWTGVAMVEFKICGNIPYLMEINGRFWGSIEVAIRSGLNYPIQLYEMEVLGKDIERNIPFKQVRVRNLREEIMQNIAKGNIGSFLKWFVSLGKSFSSRDYIEDNFFSDPGFVFALYKRDIKRILGKLRGRFTTIKRRTLKIENNKNYSIAFVCMGNICRSPFAEMYARKKVTAHTFSSMGTADIEKRMPPVNAVLAAKEYGIDLNIFLSSSVNSKNLGLIDYFIVMDVINYNQLVKSGIDERKIFFLSEHDISDPYRKDLDFFKKTYKVIAQRIDDIF